MHRFYADERGVTGDIAHLSPEDQQHALRVLRMKPGDPCQLFWQDGRYEAEIAAIEGGEVSVRVLRALPTTEPRLRVTLFQGLPKADKMELIVQKAVELGAERIVPVAMSRCMVRLDERDARKKQERWQKIAREASKQSGRCIQPEVEAPVAMQALSQRLAAFDAAIVPWEDAHTVSLTAVHRAHPEATRLAVVIGPEGGMSEQEIAAMQAAGCVPVTLGPRILRTETAGLCTLSALMCLYGDME